MHIEIVGSSGKSRLETLAKTYQTMMDIMFPKGFLFWLWLGKTDATTRETVCADLGKNVGLTQERITQLCAFAEQLDRLAGNVRYSYSEMRRVMARIVRNAKALQSLLMELRPVMRPRQGGYFALWVHKTYPELDTEKVLSYGNNSTELLNLDS